ncbi:ADP-ribosylation factor, partial [Ceratobasidium sp. AG-I]
MLGKTTILKAMHWSDISTTTPTPGFDVKSLTFVTTTFAIWNVGEEQYRSHWEQFFPGTTGIAFVVDADDRQRVPQVREEMNYLLSRL